jgi:hypothetical protein
VLMILMFFRIKDKQRTLRVRPRRHFFQPHDDDGLCSISSSPSTKVNAAHSSSTCPNTGLSILQVELSRHVSSDAKNLKR